MARTSATDGSALAVRSSSATLTYRSLDEQASLVTGYLTEHGVGEGARVVIHMRRSPGLFPALLGVLGAGAAFVPIDPRAPRERVQLVTQDCNAALVITDDLLREAHAIRPNAVSLEAILMRRSPAPAVPPAERPAYVLYTSGSTGAPKGVVVGSGALHRYLDWARTAYGMDEGTGAPLFTSIAFDATLTSLFGPLLAGRTVTLLSEDDPVMHLAEALRQAPDFSFVKATPQHVRLLTELLDGTQIDAAMRRLVVGGDELDAATIARWVEICPVPVVNEYGPTETVVGCTAFTVDPHEVGQVGRSVPIGRAIAGASVYLLDDGGFPAAPGSLGEIFIGGPSADNHYLSRPGQTASRFVPDPFAVAGSRMYRTGDLAVLRSDGVLEFHGRNDRQVKIRGYRVELGEIETAVRSLQGVVDVAAYAEWSGPDLTAVAVYSGRARVEEVRDQLNDLLPEWAIPARVVRADHLPMTVNAKTDLTAVADLSSSSSSGDDLRTQPASDAGDPLVSMLIREFSAVLPTAAVIRDSNFYECGGDSMRAIRLVARLRKLGHNVRPADLTAAATPEDLAAVLAGTILASDADNELMLGQEIAMTPAQRDFAALGLPNPSHWNQNILLEAPHGLDRERLAAAVTTVAARHDVLQYRFRGGRQIYVGGSPAVDFQEWTVPDRDGLDAAVRRANAHLDLETGPLARVVLTHLDNGPDHLVIVAHHLIVDEVSWHILLDDLADEYRSSRQAAVNPPTGGFARWRAALEAFAERPEVQARQRFWDNVLATPCGVIPRTADQPDDYAFEAYLSDGLDDEATDALRRATEHLNVGVQEALLGAVAAAFREAFDIGTPSIDVESHGRIDLGPGFDASRVMGWCTAIFPVVLPGSSTLELVRSARQMLDRMPWHGAEFGLLRQTEATPSRTSEILFNFLGERDREVDIESGWTLADPPAGSQAPPEGHRPYLLEFQSVITDGCVRWEWRYGRHHSQNVVQALSDCVRSELRGLIDHAAGDPATRFADSGLSAADLATVMEQFTHHGDEASLLWTLSPTSTR